MQKSQKKILVFRSIQKMSYYLQSNNIKHFFKILNIVLYKIIIYKTFCSSPLDDGNPHVQQTSGWTGRFFIEMSSTRPTGCQWLALVFVFSFWRMLRGLASSLVQAQRSCLSRCNSGWHFVGLHSSVASRSADMATAAAASAADDFLLELQRARRSLFGFYQAASSKWSRHKWEVGLNCCYQLFIIID